MRRAENKIAKKMMAFTLVELLVAVSIFAIIIGITGVMVNFFFNSYYFNLEETQSLDEAKILLDRFVAEVREARESEEGAYPIETANDQEIIFYADSDNDGEVERLRYFLEGTELKSGLIEPASPPTVYDPATEKVRTMSDFVRNESNPVFYYYNSDWPGDQVNNPLVQSARLLNTSLVEINVTVNSSPGQLDDLNFSTKVKIRNLGDN